MKRMLHGRQSFAVLLFFLFLILFAGPAWCSEEQDAAKEGKTTPETFMTLAVQSVDSFFQDIRKIGEVSSNPAFSAMIEGPIRQYFGRDFMDSLDLEAPAGIVMQRIPNEDQSLVLMGFPLEDPMLLIDVLTGKNADIEFTEREDGIIEYGGLFMKAENGWTWIMADERQAEQLANRKPEELFGIGEDATFQIKLFMKHMPKEFREMVRKNIEEGVMISTEPLDEESEEDHALRQAKAKAAQKQKLLAFDDLEQISIAGGIHSETGAVEWKTQLRLVPDSQASLEYAKRQKTRTSEFLSFTNVPGTFGMSWVQSALKWTESTPLLNNAIAAGDFETFKKLSLEDLQQKSWLEGARDFFGGSEKGKAVTQLLEERLAELDQEPAGATLVLDAEPGKTSFVYGMQMKEPEKMKELAARIAEWAQEKTETAKKIRIEKNIKLENGILCDKMTLPTPEFCRLIDELTAPELNSSESELAEMTQYFGEQVVLLIGASEGNVFVCLGSSPEEKLTECLGSAQKTQDLFEIRLDFQSFCRSLRAAAQIQLEALKKKAAEDEMNAKSSDDETKSTKSTKTKKDEDAEKDKNAANVIKIEVDLLGKDLDLEDQMRKSIRQYETILAIMDETDTPNVRLTGSYSENVLTYRITLESGITKIIGTLPSLILMNAF